MAVITQHTTSPYAKLRSVDPGAVRWLPGFWGARFAQCHKVTLPHLWELMDDPERGHALTNLRIAAAAMQGGFLGTHWQDEWVYKWIEAASYVYQQTHDPWLDARMDEAIDVIARAQAPDGYIATQIQLRGWPRFHNKSHHEVYVMGHLLSAACVHYRATGKTSFLNVARKTGDFLYRTFMPPRDPSLAHIVFNPSQIMGLVELYRTTGNRRYLDVANACIDMHGAEPGGTDQTQDRVPLRDETQVVGHMVLGTYLYTGATDAYLETGDESLLQAMERLWDDLTSKRMYVHGGICAVHRGFSIRPREVGARQSGTPGKPTPPAGPLTRGGYPGHLVHRHLNDVHEAAGDDYDLPNSTGYNETCAQIGSVLWNWRLLAASAQARHADLIEHTLYNSVLSGIGLDGASWFYTNPLRFYGKTHKLLTQDAYERFQPGRQHVCCPSNLLRIVAGLYGYLYSTSEDGLWLNLYGASVFDGDLPAMGRLRLIQETNYPWDGAVKLTVETAPEQPFTLYLRVPAWTEAASITVNGQPADVEVIPSTYAAVCRAWHNGDIVELNLPMPVRLLEGNPRVEHTRNQAAVARGPLIYCLESHDLPEHVALLDVYLSPEAKFTPRYEPELLNGVTVLEAEADVIRGPDWNGQLYRPLIRRQAERQPIRLVPYYAWANRGTGEMTVWLPLSSRR